MNLEVSLADKPLMSIVPVPERITDVRKPADINVLPCA